MQVTEGKTVDNNGNTVHFLKIHNNEGTDQSYHVPSFVKVTGVASPSFDKWLPWRTNELAAGDTVYLRIEQGTLPSEAFDRESLPGGANYDEETSLWTPNRAQRRAGVESGFLRM